MKVLVKKCVDPHFVFVQNKTKLFEIRFNDCDYKEGDLLIQRQYDPERDFYSGEVTFHRIGHVSNYEQKKGYVVFSLLNPDDKEITKMYYIAKEFENAN